jgi:L-rhamnose-H+ transport protein
MSLIIALLIISLGILWQSSYYVPIRKVKNWSWECFWLMQGVFAWLIFPYVGVILVLSKETSFFTSDNAIWKCIAWGIGGLSFGLSMRYLGVAMGQLIALGTCSALGTFIPAILKGGNLFKSDGLILLVSVCIAIAVISYAGNLRSQNMSEEEKLKAVLAKNFKYDAEFQKDTGKNNIKLKYHVSK